MQRLTTRLTPKGDTLSFCYEAGPCGYGVYRELTGWGPHCDVVVSALVPRVATDRVKADRRDALKLTRLHRAGELTRVWVLDTEQEAMRDLTLAQEDMTALQPQQYLGAVLLRHHRVYLGQSRWTPTYKTWLLEPSFEDPVQVVFQDYVDACHEATWRVTDLDDQIREAAASWSFAPVVEALIGLRGLDVLSAVTVLAERGGITRFNNPRQLMSVLGLVPNEHSSRARRRTVTVTSGISWRRPPRTIGFRRTRHGTSPRRPERVQTLAWPAQKRLCGRDWSLSHARKHPCKVTTAVARELVGVIWAIVCEVTDHPHGSRALA